MNYFSKGILITLCLLLACQSPKERADLIITNANIYTLSWSDPDLEGRPAADAPIVNGDYQYDAEAIAIKNGKILFVGSNDAVKDFTNEATRTIDAQQAIIVPGLIESHGHLNEIGEKKEAIQLQGLTHQEIIDLIAERAKSLPKGEWIIASGWDEAAFANDYPDMMELGNKVPDHPVVLIGLRGFGVMGNPMAFEKAGITKDSETPKGGKILLNKEGSLQYVLLNQAKRLLLDGIPQKTLAQQVRIMNYGFEELMRLGFTTTHHLGVDQPHMEAYQFMNQNEQLPMRVHAFVAARAYNIALVDEWLANGPTSDSESFLQVRGFKGYYDGSLGSRGAKFIDAYSDKPEENGVSGLAYGFDEQLIRKALDKGFQMAIHAIGDQANRDVLDLYEAYFEQHPEAKELRHRIEHVQVVHPEDFKRFSKLNVIASMEPAHALEDMPWAIDRIGEERAKGAYAWRTLRRNKATLIFNSDFTGSDPSFFYGMYCAITKKSLKDEKTYYPEQAVTAEEALRAYTIWGAYASHQEEETGSIEVGKWADLTFMNVDPLNANPEAILNGKILKTMINGKMVYDANGNE